MNLKLSISKWNNKTNWKDNPNTLNKDNTKEAYCNSETIQTK